ncbi:hypothetical protein D3C78_847680 [compost metagenome]
MDMMQVERMLKLFGWPLALMLAALLGMMVVSGAGVDLLALAAPKLRDMLSLLLLSLLGCSVFWLLLNTWRLYCWESGTWKGACLFCGGHMQTVDGLSVCLGCSARREGWN